MKRSALWIGTFWRPIVITILILGFIGLILNVYQEEAQRKAWITQWGEEKVTKREELAFMQGMLIANAYTICQFIKETNWSPLTTEKLDTLFRSRAQFRNMEPSCDAIQNVLAQEPTL
jgi:hypothetical protein